MTTIHKCLVKCRRMVALVLSHFVVFPVLANWAYDEQASWEYQVEDDEATVTCIYPKSHQAFYGCVNLVSVDLPESVVSIGCESFRGSCFGRRRNCDLAASWAEEVRFFKIRASVKSE